YSIQEAGDSLHVSMLLSGLDSQPGVLVSTSIPRELLPKTSAIVRYSRINLLLLGVLSTLLIWLVIERSVVARVGRIGRFFRGITESGDPNRRVETGCRDESNRLREELNLVLDQLQVRTSELQVMVLQAESATAAKS